MGSSRVGLIAIACTMLVVSTLVGPSPGAAAPTGQFSGSIFNDRNQDGVRDPGEEPLAGLVLELRQNRQATPDWDVLATATSDAAGNYRFTAVPLDEDFQIRPAQAQPAHTDLLGFNTILQTTFLGGYRLSTSTAGLDELFDPASIDIGITRGDRYSVSVWVDRHHDGIRGQDERAPDDWEIQVLDTDGAIVRTLDYGGIRHDPAILHLWEGTPGTRIRVVAHSHEYSFEEVPLTLAYDPDGGADGELVIERSPGPRIPSYEVYYTFPGNFGGVVGGCSVAQPTGWAVDAVADPIAAQVWRLYSAFLLRQPDQVGFDYWLGIRRIGNPHTVVAESFAAATEFANRYGSLNNAQYVRLLYHNVLCRQPDAAGYNYWMLQLEGGLTRGEAMLYFSEGAEYLSRTGTAHPLLP